MPQPIRILAPAKETGDLFTRLVSDLFLALGYDNPRLNIHKTGREIDVLARHRLESRWALAECKATAKPIGGADLNKFAGVLEAERRRHEEQVVGYFISLSGYTEAALEQEKELAAPPRFVPLNGQQVVEQLVKGRIVASRERALERAGRSAAMAGADLIPEDQPQLLSHAIGWVWAVLFRRNAEVTHLALIHADGENLSPRLAKEILDSDREAEGDLHRLTYLVPRSLEPAAEEGLAEAQAVYFRYIAAECGEIELEGLPADHDIGTRRLRLESLFVPLHLEPARPEPEEKTEKPVARAAPSQRERLPVGKVLADRAHLAILALPGGGKTTLLRRLAVAYAFPDRQAEIGDHLPDRPWFPLFIRCRQIEERATEPIIQLLGRMGERAELGDRAEDFRTLVLAQIREGKALLLIDGLDEIAEPGQRMAFVHQLRTFLSTYPGVSVVVTAREAGFRIVAGSLSAHCDHFRIASFDQKDIERLAVAWHREVVGNKPEVETQARALAASIWETDRIRRLAVNPLLLTTLLLVRRWVGQLPSRRSVLYEKAIEVLLWTWNVEGFAPLDVEEVTPQLCFLAWQMMEDGVQQVTQPRLRKILQEARRQMPEVLSYAKLGVGDFVDRVEGRSGLLVLSGQSLEDGRLVSVYEFRHLTFQEYLAAKALVEGFYAERSNSDTLVSKLTPHFEEESWKEVVPLVAVLAGRKAAPLVEALVERVEVLTGRGGNEDPSGSIGLLIQCLLDEVQIPPDAVDQAFEVLARISWAVDPWESPISKLVCGRYGPRLREVCWRAFSTSDRNLFALGDTWLAIGFEEKNWPHQCEPLLVDEAMTLCESAEPRNRALGLLLAMQLAYDRSQGVKEVELEKRRGMVALEKFAAPAALAVSSSALWEQFGGAWALFQLSKLEAVPEPLVAILVRSLLDLWLEAKSQDLVHIAAVAFQHLPVLMRETQPLSTPDAEQVRKVVERYETSSDESFFIQGIAALVAAFYWRQPWSDEELVTLLLKAAQKDRSTNRNWTSGTLSQLGQAGWEALRQLESESRPSGEVLR